jgi:competence protein ComEA
MSRPPDRERERQRFANRPFKEQLRDLLSLHKTERRGNAAAMLLLALAIGALYYYQTRYKPSTADLEPIRAQMEAWLAARDSARIDPIKSPADAEPFPFDPNHIGEEEWQRLGLSARQAAAIMRYRDKGGRFRSKADVRKMYTIRPEQFERLRPFILLPDSAPARSEKPQGARNGQQSRTPFVREEDRFAPRPAREPLRKLEVNTADTTALIALPGIGPAFARGIVKYRDGLGGYYALDQLAEVYLLQDKPDAVARLKELLTLDTLMIRRIPLNTCTAEELAAHPYIRWKLARPIVAYRQQHGPFKEVAAIRSIHLIDEALYRKLAPYLSVE